VTSRLSKRFETRPDEPDESSEADERSDSSKPSETSEPAQNNEPSKGDERDEQSETDEVAESGGSGLTNVMAVQTFRNLRTRTEQRTVQRRRT